jgi:hypothetical protein
VQLLLPIVLVHVAKSGVQPPSFELHCGNKSKSRISTDQQDLVDVDASVGPLAVAVLSEASIARAIVASRRVDACGILAAAAIVGLALVDIIVAGRSAPSSEASALARLVVAAIANKINRSG